MKLFALATLLTAVIVIDPAAGAADPERSFDVVGLAPGVYALVQNGPAALFPRTNNVFIVNDTDVMVVDTARSADETRQAIAALREVTAKPVRYVINTHGHDDHALGNAVYRQAFREVEFIGHLATVSDAPAAAGRRTMATRALPATIDRLRTSLRAGVGIDGAPIGAAARAAYQADLERAESYRGDHTAVPVLPTLPLTDRLTLRRGGRTIEILSFGGGHSPSDLVVYLPAERILVAGDLVTLPVPYVGEGASIRRWALALAGLVALDPLVTVPGHGPVLRDTVYLTQLAGLFGDIDQEVRDGGGDPIAAAPDALARWRPTFAGQSPLGAALFDRFVAGEAVRLAAAEADRPVDFR